MSECTIDRALIIGAGPGGLTAAIGLRQAGIAPLVYEHAPNGQAGGSGLTLWPNAMQALGALGLAEPICTASQRLEGLAMHRWQGDRLFCIPAEAMIARFGGSGRALSRAALVEVLAQHLGEEALHYGVRCVGFRQDEAGVTASFDDGSEARGDLLIGADGLRSATRASLFAEAALRYAGFTVWRGIADFDLTPKAGVTALGPGAQFGFFALTRGRVYWFASANAPEGAPDGRAGRKAEVLDRFVDWYDLVGRLIEATDEAAILRNDIYDMDPLERWSAGRVTLLGDAAHPFAPTLGQGACQAIEDAVVLAACLPRHGTVAAALSAYEARRVRRARSITLESRRIGQVGQWENPIACWVRNRLIKSTPDALRLKQLEALFRFEH